jgi:hypothetical protein
MDLRKMTDDELEAAAQANMAARADMEAKYQAAGVAIREERDRRRQVSQLATLSVAERQAMRDALATADQEG